MVNQKYNKFIQVVDGKLYANNIPIIIDNYDNIRIKKD